MADDYSPPVTPLNDSTSVPVSRTRKRLAAAQRDSGNSELWSKEMSLERKESVLSVESEMSNHMTPSDKYSSKGRSVSIETPSGSKQQNQPLQNGSKPKTGGCPFAHGASADASETSPENSDMAYLYDQLRGLDTESNLDDNDDRSSMASGATHSSSLDAMSRFRQLQILLDRFAEGCLTPVVMIDSRGLIRSVNTETLNLFGYRRWEMIGRNVEMIVPPGVHRDRHAFYMERYMKTKCRRIINERRTHIKAVKKDGSEIPVVLRVTELDDLNGSSVFVGFIEDLTQAHQLEKITAIFNSMMPASIRQRITAGEERIADLCDATVIFVDVCNFTAYSRTKHPTEVVEFLARIFKVFGIIAQQYSVLQIKTIGDAMLLCINATTPRFMDGPVRAMETAIDIQKYMRANEEHKVRVGIATGTVVAGVMATDRPNFDVFGDAVNLASRLQTSAPVGGILVDEKTYDQTNHMYQYNVPTTMDIKGVGDVVTYAFSRKKMESHGSADDLHNSTQKA